MKLLNALPAIAVLLMLLVFCLSCNKNGHSISVPDAAAINVFNASHVYDSMARTRRVSLSGLDTMNTSIRMSFVGYGNYEIPGMGLVEPIRLDHPMRFYDFSAGTQRIQFSDTAGAIVADTSFVFSAGSSTGIYLADDTTHISTFAHNGQFRVFNFPEQRTFTDGKLRVRYIDLVPDIDTLNGYFYTPTGRFTGYMTPHALNYGTASNYYDMDTTGLPVSGQILLRLFRKKDTLNYFAQVPIPSTPGRTYTVVLFGNAGYWYCGFPVTKPDGTTSLKYISYPPDIRGYVRTVD